MDEVTEALRPAVIPPPDRLDDERRRRQRARWAAYARERRMHHRYSGPLELKPRITMAALAAARAAGIDMRRVAAATNERVSYKAVAKLAEPHSTRSVVLRRTAVALLEALEQLAAEQQTRLDTLHQRIARLERQLYPPQRWDAEVLRQVVRNRGIVVVSALGETDSRYFYGSRTMSTERADQLCLRLGLMPEVVWDGWGSRQPEGGLSASA